MFEGKYLSHIREFFMRVLSLLLISLFFASVVCAVDGDLLDFGSGLPAEAQKLIDQSNEDMVKTRQGLVTNLNKVLVKVTKTGNLDGANAVKAKIFENICIGVENLMEDLGVWDDFT